MGDDTVFTCRKCGDEFLKKYDDEMFELAIGIFGRRKCELCGELVDTHLNGEGLSKINYHTLRRSDMAKAWYKETSECDESGKVFVIPKFILSEVKALMSIPEDSVVNSFEIASTGQYNPTVSEERKEIISGIVKDIIDKEDEPFIDVQPELKRDKKIEIRFENHWKNSFKGQEKYLTVLGFSCGWGSSPFWYRMRTYIVEIVFFNFSVSLLIRKVSHKKEYGIYGR